MAFEPIKVPEKTITSYDITGWSGGLSLLGKQEIKENQFTEAKNITLSTTGDIQPRPGLVKWLPDTKGKIFQIKTVLIDGELYHFTVDENKVKYIKADNSVEGKWTACGGDNNVASPDKAKTILLRAKNTLFILNGVDKFSYVDLKQPGFPVVKSVKVDDPTQAPTVDTAEGKLTGTAHKIYYGFTFTSTVGETKLSPIATVNISKQRDTWKQDGTEYLKIQRPKTNPTGARNWNLYAAISSNAGTIRDTDMILVASGLDMANYEIIDNGRLAFDIARGNPPQENRTDGMRCAYGIEINGRPILYGDTDNPYAIWVGGDNPREISFSSADGAYRAEGQAGTDYYPTGVVGFRNNQGTPDITVLYSNTEGLSKQAILAPKTFEYGEQSFVAWTLTDQNYGAAGVSSPYAVVNYNGSLTFPTTDGMMTMGTKAQLQNVLSTDRISEELVPFFKRVSASALEEIVGTAWDNKMYYIIPSDGKSTPDKLMIRDMNNNGAWTIADIPAQWVGVVSPKDSSAFIYICQGNKIYRLVDIATTTDYIDGKPVPFATRVESGMIGFNGAYNTYRAIIQVVFYLLDLSGDVWVGVRYKDRFSGKIKTKRKKVSGPRNRLTVAKPLGNWSDGQFIYNSAPMLAGWSKSPRLDLGGDTQGRKVDKRAIIRLSKLASEVQFFVETVGADEHGYVNHASYRLSSVSFEGVNIGIKADLR